MGRPRHYWYGISKTMIKRYPNYMGSDQEKLFIEAIESAITETGGLPNGELRLKAINDVLINKTKTIQGVALDTFYNERTVYQWIYDFVNLVGQKAGY